MTLLQTILLGQLVCVPIYVAVYFNGREKRRHEEYLATMAEKEAEIAQNAALDKAKYRRILFDALRALKKAGTGAPWITDAIRAEELDQELALATIRLSRRDTMKWADASTEDSARHWNKVSEIFDAVEERIKGEGE